MNTDRKKLRWLSQQTINGPQLGRKGLAECHAAIPVLLDEIELLESMIKDIGNNIIKWEQRR